MNVYCVRCFRRFHKVREFTNLEWSSFQGLSRWRVRTTGKDADYPLQWVPGGKKATRYSGLYAFKAETAYGPALLLAGCVARKHPRKTYLDDVKQAVARDILCGVRVGGVSLLSRSSVGIFQRYWLVVRGQPQTPTMDASRYLFDSTRQFKIRLYQSSFVTIGAHLDIVSIGRRRVAGLFVELWKHDFLFMFFPMPGSLALTKPGPLSYPVGEWSTYRTG